MASASCSGSRSSVPSSDGSHQVARRLGRARAGATGGSASAPSGSAAHRVRSRARPSSSAPSATSARSRVRGAELRGRGAAAPARARRARSGRCRASSGRAPVRRGACVQPAPPAAAGSPNWSAALAKRARNASLSTRMLSRWSRAVVAAAARRRPPPRRRRRSPAASAPRGRRRRPSRAASRETPPTRLAPQRIGEHDLARARRVAELGQRGVEALSRPRRRRRYRKPSRSSSALSWSVLRICSPRPSLPITSRQLLATSSRRRDAAPTARANSRALSSPTSRVMRSILMPPSCSSTIRSSMRRAAAASARPRRAASSICSATRCEWLATKLTRSSWLSTPTHRVAVAHQHAVHAVAQHQHSASKQLVVGRAPSIERRSAPTSRTGSAVGALGRSSASRRSVVVKMPSRSPSRTSALVRPCSRRARGTRATRSSRAVDVDRLAQQASRTRAVTSDEHLALRVGGG